MSDYVLEKLAIPIIIGVISGFITLWIWRINSTNSDRKKLYLPIVNNISRSLTNLIPLIERDYPRALLEDTFENIYDNNFTSTEFFNLPENIKHQLGNIVTEKHTYLKTLSILIKKISPLESKITHKEYPEDTLQFYIINFLLLKTIPDNNILINFPVDHGCVHCLYCNKVYCK